MLLAESFLVLVAQELMLALGVALAGANAWALIQNRRRRRAYGRDVDAYEAAKRDAQPNSKRPRRPEEPELAKAAPAVVNIVIGTAIALVAFASLTFDWIT